MALSKPVTQQQSSTWRVFVQNYKLIFPIFLLTLSQIVSGETLLKKIKNQQDLTAVELTAIFLAEVKACEDNVPGFKSSQIQTLLS